MGSWHVVVLNTACDHTGDCGLGSPQDTWLRNDLANNSAVCTLALFHDNLYSSGDVHGNNPDMRFIWEALYENGADLVLNGNEHVYERFLPQDPFGGLDLTYGITQITVGTGGYMALRLPRPAAEQRRALQRRPRRDEADAERGRLRLALPAGDRQDVHGLGLARAATASR